MNTMETTLRSLKNLLNDPELSVQEAINLLGRIHRRETDIPKDVRVYNLLQRINVEDMRTRPHRGEPKKTDRASGLRLHKIRTGSKHG